ncbi:MAG: GTP cyclohydrolase I, partial [Tepidiformaceae bacterium]
MPGEIPIAPLVEGMLAALGEDPGREGLVKTPERVEQSLRWLTQGYGQTVRDAVGDAIFEESHQSMIMVRDIELYSLCEHHILPFFGRAHVAYVPDGKIMGLSKAARIVDVFARRLQVQERLTDQIADAVMEVLAPHGVG